MSELYYQIDPIAEEKNLLMEVRRCLNWERRAWKICGIFFLIYGIICLPLGAMMMNIAIEQGDQFLIRRGVMLLVYALTFLPSGIVDLIAAAKIKKPMEIIYFDSVPAINRCSSVGRIVFTAMFCTVALVFYLINFIRIKIESAKVAQILARQRGEI